MRPKQMLLGTLGAAVGALSTAPLAWLLVRGKVFTGIAGLLGFLLSAAGWRLAAGRSTGFGVAISALLVPPAALPGLYYGCAELILLDNARFGCTMEEALDLVPSVALDPINQSMLLWTLGGILVLDLLCAILFSRYLRLRRLEKQ